MSDKEIIEDALSEGIGLAVREGWIDPSVIQDLKLRLALKIATDSWRAFEYACHLAELESERVCNDAG